MKSIFSKLLILGVVSSLIVFFGCKKEDDIERNQIIIDSKDYSLDKGYQANTDTLVSENNTTTYAFDIYLLGSGITYNNDLKKFDGSGNYIYLRMYSMNPEYLTPGSYTLDGFSSKDSLTFDYGVVGFNTNVTVAIGDSVSRFKMGVVKVNKRGSIYQLDFEYYLDDNKQVKGSYSGLLDQFTIAKIIPPSGVGILNFQSQSYPLNYGSLDSIDVTTYSPKTYEFELSLVGPGITWDKPLSELTGKGNSMVVKIFSTYSDSLKTGTYVFNKVRTEAPFTFADAGVGINYNFDSSSQTGLYIIKSGTINISRNNDNYIVVFDLTTATNIKSIGQFTGILDLH